VRCRFGLMIVRRRCVIVGGVIVPRHAMIIVVVFRLLGGLLGFVLLGLERYGPIDLRFAIDFQKGKAEQARDDADQHPADKKRPDHGGLYQLVAGKAEKVATVMDEFMHVHAADE
jgi:hypothetical protein